MSLATVITPRREASPAEETVIGSQVPGSFGRYFFDEFSNDFALFLERIIGIIGDVVVISPSVPAGSHFKKEEFFQMSHRF